VLNLLGGQLDKAVALLRKATQQDSANASNWSDLAAAHLARYGKKDSFADLLDALQAAKQAVEADSNHPEARFNFALALDHLSLRWRARAAWSRYRDLDDHSEWSREAGSRFSVLFQPSYSDLWKKHRAALEQANPAEIEVSARKLVRLFPQQAREMVEEDLLGRWAVQRSQSRLAEAERTLALAKAVGIALADSRGEYMLADSVMAIEVAVGEGTKSLDWLIAGHIQHQRGLEKERSEEFQAASRHFKAAGEDLAVAGSPFELWTRFRLAVCEGQLFQYRSALSRLDGLGGALNWTRYPALQARAAWVSGLYHVIRGNPAESLAAYRHASEIFGHLGEQENCATISNLLAETHRKLGDLPGAWRYHGLAVDGLRFVVSARRRWPILAELGVSLADARPGLSVYAHEELLRGYTNSVSPAVRVGGIRRMAEAKYREKDRGKALSLIRMAEREVGFVSEPRVREALQGDLLALEGQVESEVDSYRAIRLLTAAINSCKKTEYRWRLVRLLLERARTLRRAGRLGLAESSLLSAIKLVELYGSSESLVAPSFDEIRQVFQEIVVVQVLQGRLAAAFEFSEKGRARILSLMAPAELPPIPLFTLEEIKSALPKNVAMVNWWIGEQEIFVWIVRRDNFEFVTVPVDTERLFRAVTKFRTTVSSNNLADASAVGMWLHARLIGSAMPYLRDSDRLVFVPDGVLSTLPFAALRESPDSKYLVEQHVFSLVPTASLFLHSLLRARQMSSDSLGVVAFGNPSFDRSLFGNLPLLAYSSIEAEQVVSIYPKGNLFVGSSATRLKLESEAPIWPILHIGGHVVANAVNPFTSALALAPSSVDAGVFYFRDFSKMRLNRTRLAVFSACSTLRGQLGAGTELAGPLLTQGVPAVVGTLWPVQDKYAGLLTLSFHRRFRASRDAAVALRETQLELLANPAVRAVSSVWAAFELAGAQ
jgi:CHAT domain-containing protein